METLAVRRIVPPYLSLFSSVPFPDPPPPVGVRLSVLHHVLQVHVVVEARDQQHGGGLAGAVEPVLGGGTWEGGLVPRVRRPSTLY